jgi:hypothetical protein
MGLRDDEQSRNRLPVKYVYDRTGEAKVVLEAGFLFDMEGYPCGFVDGTQVYTMKGTHVGELYRDMVVNTYTSSPGRATPPASPGRIPRPERVPGRGPLEYGYPCLLAKLFEDPT